MTLRAVPLATQKIVAEVEGGIGWLRINQPERRNAIAELVNRCFDSDDYREGRRAFMEKRTPRFTGR
jgi:enoyl-CoA hydratase/carnithine racemase